MPSRASKPCKTRGCPGVVVASSNTCSQGHAQYVPREKPVTPAPAEREPEPRGTAHERGYGATWRKLRRMVLAESPLCVDPFKAHKGQAVPASEVDHIVPLRRGGTNAFDNLQTLCRPCHQRKTAEETAEMKSRKEGI